MKVMAGPNAGETGTVQLSEAMDSTKEDSEFIAVLLLDSGLKEIQCFVNDLEVTVCALSGVAVALVCLRFTVGPLPHVQLSVEMSTSGASLDGYSLYDFVEVRTDSL